MALSEVPQDTGDPSDARGLEVASQEEVPQRQSRGVPVRWPGSSLAQAPEGERPMGN